jgi:hypothetical protein
MEKRKAPRTEAEMPVAIVMLGNEYAGNVRNYSRDGAFIEILDDVEIEESQVLHSDVDFTFDETMGHIIKPKGKAVRVFSSGSNMVLAVRFLDYM